MKQHRHIMQMMGTLDDVHNFADGKRREEGRSEKEEREELREIAEEMW